MRRILAEKSIIIRSLLILVILGLALVADWPGGPDIKIGDYTRELKIRLGLDLQGGTQLTYEADLSKAGKDKGDAIAGAIAVIQKRVDAFGVSEPVVQSVGTNRIIVELPGVKDVQEAIDLIGKTAQLQFKEQGEGEAIESGDALITPQGMGWKNIEGLDGSHFEKADVKFNDQTGEPEIAIQFDNEGSKIFADATKKNISKPIAIFLDEEVISAPTVQNEITDGKAVITGKFTVEEARDLAKLLNAGALPVPISMIEQHTVGATLGQDSIRRSIDAGIIGIIIVVVFMLAYYRFMGIFSTIGLGLYLVFMVAIVKLLGITVTMGGIAGLILSVGMSMETDVLVFERIRESLRAGKNFPESIPLGFQKAWPSIRDSNAVSLVITALLYTAGGTIRGFAVVLGFGIIVGLLTTFLGTKVLLEIAVKFKILHRYGLFAVEKYEKEAV